MLNNVVFVALALAIFWGSFGAPIVSALFLVTEITLGAPYFHQVTIPLFIAMYILMGVAPLAAWGAMSLRALGRSLLVPLALTGIGLVAAFALGAQSLGALLGYGVVLLAGFVAVYEIYRGVQARRRSSGQPFLAALLAILGRNRRRYGGFVVHLGIVVIGIGVIGSSVFQQDTIRQLRQGETLTIGAYTLRFEGMALGQIADDGRLMDIANVTVLRDGQPVAALRPRIDQYPSMPITIAGAHSTLENDVYVLLAGYDRVSGTTATLHVYLNPLINLVWWGGLILIVGTAIAAWKDERVPVRARQSAPTGLTAPARV